MTRMIHPTQPRQPHTGEVGQVLHRLYVACASGHFRLAENTRGRAEFENAMKEARETIQRLYHGRKEHLP